MGAERNGTGEFLHFLGIASGSLAETGTWLTPALRLNLLTTEQVEPLMNQATPVDRMIKGLKRSLRSKA